MRCACFSLVNFGDCLPSVESQTHRIEFPLLRPAIIGAGLFGFLLSFNEILRTIFLRGTETTMPVYNWTMAASQQSQVPIIFALATILLAVTLPLLGGAFWLLYARMDKD